MLMVDWLTAEIPDPIGVPINDGHVCRIRSDGSLDWSTACRRQLEGSWSSSMTFRAVGAEYVEEQSRALMELGRSARRRSGVEVSGNPAKFLEGHNLFGSDDPVELLQRVVDRASPLLWPDLPQPVVLPVSEANITRIDLTGTWQLEREGDVPIFLRAMEKQVWCPYRGRGVMDSGGSTLYYGRTAKGKRAKDWALKIYWKGPEITAHPLPKPAYEVPGMLEDVNRWLRVELTLRSPELKRLGLRKLGDWTPDKVREIWEAYVEKLDFGEATVNLDTADLGALGLKPRHAHAIAAWKAGNDLRAGMSARTFYRLRKEVKEATGFDIATEGPVSNVVQLRRVISVSPVLKPHWADHLAAVLRRVA